MVVLATLAAGGDATVLSDTIWEELFNRTDAKILPDYHGQGLDMIPTSTVAPVLQDRQEAVSRRVQIAHNKKSTAS